jgi:hypothetical protein
MIHYFLDTVVFIGGLAVIAMAALLSVAYGV